MNTEVANIDFNIDYDDDTTYESFLNLLDGYECGICIDNTFGSTGRNGFTTRYVRMYVFFREEDCGRLKEGLVEILGETRFVFDTTSSDTIYTKLQFRGNRFAGRSPREEFDND
jgi:hypothetical protein